MREYLKTCACQMSDEQAKREADLWEITARHMVSMGEVEKALECREYAEIIRRSTEGWHEWLKRREAQTLILPAAPLK